MKRKKVQFPVMSLSGNITQKLMKIAVDDIRNSLDKGLQNGINLIDKDTTITDVANIDYIDPTDDLKKCVVTISVAYCQFVWLLCDILLKLVDRQVLQEGAKSVNMPLDNFIKMSLKQMSLTPTLSKAANYYKCVASFGRPSFDKAIEQEAILCEKLLPTTPAKKIGLRRYQKLRMYGKYEKLSNSACCYAIALVLLHEHGHYELGHMQSRVQQPGEEAEADQSAIWKELLLQEDDERFSMMIGGMMGFFSLLMLNPLLVPDGIHPDEDQRLLEFYMRIKDENPKYARLYEYMTVVWKNYAANLKADVQHPLLAAFRRLL